MGKQIEIIEQIVKIKKSSLNKPIVVRTPSTVRCDTLRRTGLLVKSEKREELARNMLNK